MRAKARVARRRTIGKAGADRKSDVAFLAHARRLGLLPFSGQRLGEPFSIGAADGLNAPAGHEVRGLHDGGAVEAG